MTNFLQRMFGQLDRNDVRKMATQRDIPNLLRALAYTKDEYVRVAAAEALIELGDPDCLATIIDVVKHEPDGWVPGALMDALRTSDDSRVVDAFIALLSDAKKCTRARLSLERMQAEKRLPATAAPGLIDSLDRVAKGHSASATRVIRMLGTMRDERAVPRLISILRDHQDDSQRAAALSALGEIGSVDALEAVTAALEYPDKKLHSSAASLLGRVCYRPALVPLINAAARDSVAEELTFWMPYRESLNQIDPSWGSSDAAKACASVLVPAISTRPGARDMLRAIGWQPGTDDERAVWAIAERDWSSVVALGQAAIGALKEQLDRHLEEQRQHVDTWHMIESLAAIDRRQAADVLQHMQSRWTSLEFDEVLGFYGDHRAFAPLLAELREFSSRRMHALTNVTVLVTALTRLIDRHHHQEVSEDILLAISELEDVGVLVDKFTGETMEDEDQYGRTTYHVRYEVVETIDCSGLRENALKELRRRGLR